MNDERFELASAYLDGAVTPDERATAEGDPEVMELVSRLRALSVAVGDVDPPSHEARERAIGAALGATDARAAVLPFVPRSRVSRVLSYAAAVLAVGVVGSVIVTALGGSGDDDDLATSPASTELFSTEAADDAVPEAFPAEETDGSGDAGGDTEAADDAMSTMEAMEAPADDDADSADSTARSDATVVELDLLTEAEFAELTRWLFGEDRPEAGEPDRVDLCPDVLDETVTDDSLVLVYEGRPVIVGAAGDLVRVVDPDGCDVLVEVEREHTPG